MYMEQKQVTYTNEVFYAMKKKLSISLKIDISLFIRNEKKNREKE